MVTTEGHVKFQLDMLDGLYESIIQTEGIHKTLLKTKNYVKFTCAIDDIMSFVK